MRLTCPSTSSTCCSPAAAAGQSRPRRTGRLAASALAVLGSAGEARSCPPRMRRIRQLLPGAAPLLLGANLICLHAHTTVPLTVVIHVPSAHTLRGLRCSYASPSMPPQSPCGSQTSGSRGSSFEHGLVNRPIQALGAPQQAQGQTQARGLEQQTSASPNPHHPGALPCCGFCTAALLCGMLQ